MGKTKINRIRVHVNPPLTEQRAWLQVPTGSQTTIYDCKKAFILQLGLKDQTTLELSLDGFALLDTSLASILNPESDVIEISTLLPSTSSATATVDGKATKRRKLNGPVPRKSVSTPLTAANLSNVTSNATSGSKLAAYSSASTSTTSSSSDDNSSVSSDSSTSSSSPLSTSSSSSSSSKSQSSSSSSDSSNSSSAPSIQGNRQPEVFPILRKSPQHSTEELVVPGQGKSSTRARNARKRKRAKLLKQAQQDLKKEGAVQSNRPALSKSAAQELSASARLERTEAVGVRNEGSLAEDATVKSISEAALTAAPISSTPRAEVPYKQSLPLPPQSTVKPTITDTHKLNESMKSFTQSNGNKARSLKRDASKGIRQTGSKTVFDAVDEPRLRPQDAVHALEGEEVAEDLLNLPQQEGVSQRPSSTPHTKGSEGRVSGQRATSNLIRRPQPPPPSTRSDLPPNLVVSSVDVEAEDFVPGMKIADFVAPPQTPPFWQSKAAESDTSMDGSYVNVPSVIKGSKKKGTNKNGIAPLDTLPGQKQSLPEDQSKRLSRLDDDGWSTWPDLTVIEANFEDYRKVNAPGDGEAIAVKVLELSPSSYLPALTVYYGIVLSLESSPHSSIIKLKLHPACRNESPSGQENENEDYEAIVDDGQLSRPRYFGQDLELNGEEGGEDIDTKEISLDDVVDCRRIQM